MIGTAYDVLPDGRRFVFNIVDVNTTSRAAVTVITDWFDELRAKLPVN